MGDKVEPEHPLYHAGTGAMGLFALQIKTLEAERDAALGRIAELEAALARTKENDDGAADTAATV